MQWELWRIKLPTILWSFGSLLLFFHGSCYNKIHDPRCTTSSKHTMWQLYHTHSVLHAMFGLHMSVHCIYDRNANIWRNNMCHWSHCWHFILCCMFMHANTTNVRAWQKRWCDNPTMEQHPTSRANDVKVLNFFIKKSISYIWLFEIFMKMNSVSIFQHWFILYLKCTVQINTGPIWIK
jgi:hypothetical protein